MQADRTQYTSSKLATIPMPPDFYSETAGTWFIDNFSWLAGNSRYRRGAIIGSPTTSPAMGVMGYNSLSDQYEVHEAPKGPSSWPSGASITAACAMGGYGRAIFATVDEGVRSLQVHNSALSDLVGISWDVYALMVFDGSPGPVQCMIENNGTVYGFIKNTPPTQNAFFYAGLSQTPKLVYYDGPAAAAQLPRNSNSPDNSFMLQRITYCENKIYAIDETNSNVLCASPAGVTVSPLKLPTTWGSPTARGLAIQEGARKAYCQFTIDNSVDNAYAMPYDVTDTSLEAATSPILNAGGGVCQCIDQVWNLLYLISQKGEPMVYDVSTGTPITLTGDALPSPSSGLVGFPGTWMDRKFPFLYVSGVAGTGALSNVPASVSVYAINTPQ